MVYLVIVIFEFNTCYSISSVNNICISFSVNNICKNSISLSFYLMQNLVIDIFEYNTCYSIYSISYSVNKDCNNSISHLFYLMEFPVIDMFLILSNGITCNSYI
jgi:hypothetical protein